MISLDKSVLTNLIDIKTKQKMAIVKDLPVSAKASSMKIAAYYRTTFSWTKSFISIQSM